MVSGRDLEFMKEWAVYLKRRQITNLAFVLAHNPDNCQQLAFMLQVVVQIEILRGMDGKHKLFVSHPIHFFLASCLQQETVVDLLNQALLQRILGRFQELQIKSKANSANRNILCLMAGILYQIHRSSLSFGGKHILQQLKVVAKWGYLLKQKGGIGWAEVLLQLKKWQSVKTLFGGQWHQQFVDLVLCWAIHLHIAQAQVAMDVQTQFQNEQKLIKGWMSIRPTFLLANIKEINLGRSDNQERFQQSKAIAKISGLKACKFKKQILKGLKDIILIFLLQKSIDEQLCVVFLILFTQLQIICKESAEEFHNVVTVEDLVDNQVVFYRTLWKLQAMGLLHRFNSFSSFMRNYSAQSVLQINRKIASQMIQTQKRVQSLETSIESKDRSVLFEFNYSPLALSKSVLNIYLSKSGISLPSSSSSRLATRRRLRPVLKNLVYDPLHFLLVKSCYWEELFDRDVLELSLWIILDAYIKWLQQAKPKEISDKQLAEYSKKLSLAVVVFLLQLKYPTKLLQYHAIQSDVIKDLITQPIFPTVVLNNKVPVTVYSFSLVLITEARVVSNGERTPDCRAGLFLGVTYLPVRRVWCITCISREDISLLWLQLLITALLSSGPSEIFLFSGQRQNCKALGSVFREGIRIQIERSIRQRANVESVWWRFFGNLRDVLRRQLNRRIGFWRYCNDMVSVLLSIDPIVMIKYS